MIEQTEQEVQGMDPGAKYVIWPVGGPLMVMLSNWEKVFKSLVA